MSASWEGTPGHKIIDSYGRGMGADAYGLVITCECGEIMTAVSSGKRQASKIVRGKYRAHLKGDTGNA